MDNIFNQDKQEHYWDCVCGYQLEVEELAIDDECPNCRILFGDCQC